MPPRAVSSRGSCSCCRPLSFASYFELEVAGMVCVVMEGFVLLGIAVASVLIHPQRPGQIRMVVLGRVMNPVHENDCAFVFAHRSASFLRLSCRGRDQLPRPLCFFRWCSTSAGRSAGTSPGS